MLLRMVNLLFLTKEENIYEDDYLQYKNVKWFSMQIKNTCYLTKSLPKKNNKQTFQSQHNQQNNQAPLFFDFVINKFMRVKMAFSISNTMQFIRIGFQISDIKCQMSDVRCQMLDVRCQILQYIFQIIKFMCVIIRCILVQQYVAFGGNNTLHFLYENLINIKQSNTKVLRFFYRQILSEFQNIKVLINY
ncbi:hypothetical protein pb186bvf_018647 [Paramecium bursaria]